jgi:hypothetical protein
MKTNILLPAIIILLISPHVVWSDYVIQESMQHNETPPQEVTIKLKEGKVRCDMGAAMSTISIGGDITMLMHPQKIAMKMPSSLGKSRHESSPTKSTPLQATGRKEKINGFDTEEYVHENPAVKATMHLWIAKDVPDKAEIMRMLTAMQSPAMKQMAQAFGAVSPEDYPGLPIRTEVESNLMGKPSKTTVTLTSIKKEPVDDSVFVVPADYKSAGLNGAE